MLLGKKNKVTNKLFEEISKVYSVTLVELEEDAMNSANKHNSHPYIFMNLMDIPKWPELLDKLKINNPQARFIAIHCYQQDRMIRHTLESGFDHYVSIFNFTEDLQKI